jgi:hypothetical protein
MASSQTSDLRVDEIESSIGGPPALVRGATMATAGLAVTISSMRIPGTLNSGNLVGSGSQLTNVAAATTAIAFAYNFLGI